MDGKILVREFACTRMEGGREALLTAIIPTMTGCGGFGMQWPTAGRSSLCSLLKAAISRRLSLAAW
jgi:hypothetical protein